MSWTVSVKGNGAPRRGGACPGDTTITTRTRLSLHALVTNMVADPVRWNRRSTKQRHTLATKLRRWLWATASSIHCMFSRRRSTVGQRMWSALWKRRHFAAIPRKCVYYVQEDREGESNTSLTRHEGFWQAEIVDIAHTVPQERNSETNSGTIEWTSLSTFSWSSDEVDESESTRKLRFRLMLGESVRSFRSKFKMGKVT